MQILWFMSWNMHIWHSTVCDVQKHSPQAWTELQIDVEYVQ